MSTNFLDGDVVGRGFDCVYYVGDEKFVGMIVLRRGILIWLRVGICYLDYM